MSVIIHDLDSAAERAKVTPDVVRRWIAEGLKATPVGSVGRRGPRDYRIFDSWLIEFLEARAVRVRAPEPAQAATGAPRKTRRLPHAVGPDGLWPKP